MGRPFVLPDLGEGLTEAEIVAVLVHEGDTIREDAPLLEVETDKATVEIPSPMGGRVETIHVAAGDTVKVGQVLVTFAEAAPPIPPRDTASGASSRAVAPAPAERREGPVWGPVERQPLTHLRRTIAERMTLAATVIPHVTHFDRADITELDAVIRRHLEAAKARGATLTLTAFLLKAAALALREHPTFNASLDAGAGELVVKRYVHVGIAVATARGLIVPVLRDVDTKPLLEVARELGALASRVRDGKATLDDLKGGTFTITNLGALGGTSAIPIINWPEVAILGVARGRQEAVVRDGAIVPRLLLPLTLTFDHRVADGADGARFAADIVRRLEHPDELLLGL
ncbi:MAG: 2-oxo acid dehydrogenase subunit E2 [Candidatus Rokubacteria bacterium]|nr:2-oxo acid dehydrogenase subunit E2 [Candidatus Rokubacteria bacterium]